MDLFEKIHPSFKFGEGLSLGFNCIIEEDVEVGRNVSLGHNVVLKSGTRFGDNVQFADYCKTTGLCYLGNNVNVRTDACISKGVVAEDRVFIGPSVMTNHTKHVVHGRPNLMHQQSITRIGYGAVIGSCVFLNAGIHVGDNVIIGAGAVVTKDLLEPAVYVGNPARKLKDLPSGYLILKPMDYREHFFSEEIIKKYLPDCCN